MLALNRFFFPLGCQTADRRSGVDGKDAAADASIKASLERNKVREACRRLRANDPTLTELEYVSACGLMRGALYSWGWDGFAVYDA